MARSKTELFTHEKAVRDASALKRVRKSLGATPLMRGPTDPRYQNADFHPTADETAMMADLVCEWPAQAEAVTARGTLEVSRLAATMRAAAYELLDENARLRAEIERLQDALRRAQISA